MSTLFKIIKISLLIGQLISLKVNAMDMEEDEPKETIIPSILKIDSPRSVDDKLRKEIRHHIRTYQPLFMPNGLKKLNFFLTDLKPLIDNQVLLRGDYQELQTDILYLKKDYCTLINIAGSGIPINTVNAALIEVFKVYYEEDLCIDSINANRFERQIYSLNVIKTESSQFVRTMSRHLKALPQKTLGSIQATIKLQVLLSDYLTEYTELCQQIELERRDFCLMLKRLCGESRKDILFATALNELKGLIDQYREAEQKMIQYLQSEDSREESPPPLLTPRKEPSHFGLFKKNTIAKS